MNPADWRLEALAAGAIAGVVVSFAGTQVLPMVLMPLGDASEITRYIWGMRALSMVSDLLCGAIAGWFGAPRGWQHGLVADVLMTVLGFGIGIVMTAFRQTGFDYMLMPSYWLQFLLWAVIGTGLATAAGWAAAQARQNTTSA